MDDWFTIVLFFLFFVLPLLEGVLKKKKKRGQPRDRTAPDTHRASIPDRQRAGLEPALPGGRSTTSADESSWSDDWGSWPGEESEEEDEPAEPVPSWSPRETTDSNRGGSSASELPSPPEEIAGRTPDLVTRPEAGQSSELQRLQELAARLDRVALSEGTTARPKATSPIVTLKPKRRRGPGQAALLLNDRSKVRNAFIVSEVLGPPLASRDRRQD
jgi:hypothetical protein